MTCRRTRLFDGVQVLAAHTFAVDCLPNDAHVVFNIFTALGAFLLLTPYVRGLEALHPGATINEPELALARFCEGYRMLQREAEGVSLYIENNVDFPDAVAAVAMIGMRGSK